MSGVPEVWTAPTDGGWPNLVTTLDDPVNSVEWSPSSDWLALSVAPGGGMNTQIYLVRPDGTELKRYAGRDYPNVTGPHRSSPIKQRRFLNLL
jgi:Tol biopolymer transport system component